MYDLFRDFLARAPARRSLFGGGAHRHPIPEHVAACLALQQAQVALLPTDCLVQAFEQIGRAPQRDVCPGTLPRPRTQGLRKGAQKRGHRLWLACCPCVAKALSASPTRAGDVRGLPRAGSGSHGALALLWGGATRSRRGHTRGIDALGIREGIRHVFALVDETVLMRHPREMAVERLGQALGALTDHPWGRCFRHPCGLPGSHPRPPGRSLLLGGQGPGPALPGAITPEAPGRQPAPRLLTFPRALAPPGILCALAGGHG